MLLTLALACSSGERTDERSGDGAQPAPEAVGIGHLFLDSVAGVALDLPAIWTGRYEVARGITTPEEGLQHEFALRYLKADSTPATDAPMLVARVFTTTAWQRLQQDTTTDGPARAAHDSARAARLGVATAEDATRTLVLLRASENHLTPGTADAIGYDTLMVALYSRPLRTTLRANLIMPPRDPAAPGSSAP